VHLIYKKKGKELAMHNFQRKPKIFLLTYISVALMLKIFLLLFLKMKKTTTAGVVTHETTAQKVNACSSQHIIFLILHVSIFTALFFTALISSYLYINYGIQESK
jgi:hypothetical protein